MNVNDEVVLRGLFRLSLEKALQEIALLAQKHAEECPAEMSGRDALLLFSNAILSTNAKTWPTKGEA